CKKHLSVFVGQHKGLEHITLTAAMFFVDVFTTVTLEMFVENGFCASRLESVTSLLMQMQHRSYRFIIFLPVSCQAFCC
ncbi:hypothetical protein NL529_33880, partial [Klebsiella pneumoniae]|nr:hypothetical protein [Klebsiella pneumoniae]